ncbi:hypothetical protein Tco_0343908 [Tanacetum coccineum]
MMKGSSGGFYSTNSKAYKIVYYDDDEEVGTEADMNNLATTVPVSPILSTRVHKDHPLDINHQQALIWRLTSITLRMKKLADVDVPSYTKDFTSSCCVKRIFLYLKDSHSKFGPLEIHYRRLVNFLEEGFVIDFSGNVKSLTIELPTLPMMQVVAAAKLCGQFWTTAKAKTVNEERQIQALHKKMVIITEKSVRSDLMLEDTKGFYTYTQALKKVEAQLVAHQQSQLCQMSARDKAGLGYGDQMNKVSPPITGIYILSGPDKEIDDSQFTYGPKQSKPSESDARSSDFNFCESNPSEETHESMPKPVISEPKVVSQPKVWSHAPIIEEYESDSEDEHVSLPTKEQDTPSFAFINTVVPTNAAWKVNTVKPIVNNARPKAGFHKTFSPFRKPFNNTTALRTNFSYQKVNTAKVNTVSAVGGKRETAVKPSAGYN